MKPITLKGILLGPSVVGMRKYIPEAEKRRAIALKKPMPRGTYRPAQWEPILDHQTQSALQAVIAASKREGRPARSLLAGLLICGRCGMKMGYSKMSYKCSFTAGGCSSVSVTTKNIEAHAIEMADGLLQGNPDFLAKVMGINLEPITVEPPTDELARIKDKRKYYNGLHDEELIDDDELKEHLSKLKLREQKVRDSFQADVVAAEQEKQLADALKLWKDSADNPGLRRRVLGALYSEIIIWPTDAIGPSYNRDRASFTSLSEEHLASKVIKARYAEIMGLAPIGEDAPAS